MSGLLYNRKTSKCPQQAIILMDFSFNSDYGHKETSVDASLKMR